MPFKEVRQVWKDETGMWMMNVMNDHIQPIPGVVRHATFFQTCCVMVQEGWVYTGKNPDNKMYRLFYR